MKNMDKLTYCADSKLRKPFLKPVLLKDYLLDDLSSCSSNGFRSYPRRQCCTTVRFLLEIDLNKSKQSFNKKPQQLLRSRSKSASSATMSALQRASEKVLNAVKSLPFAGVRSQSKPKKDVLPRTLSRKLLRRSFWKKTDHKEIERWKSFGELIAEKPEPEDFKATITAAAAAAAAGTDSNSSTSNSESNSWSDSDFTASSDNLQCLSGNSEVNQGENDTVESQKVVGKRVGVTTATTTTNYSAETTKKEWLNEEKEQFSPVSVMDFPCDDDDEDEVSCPFQRRLVHIEGTKKSLMHKIRRFESLATLEPIDLEKRIALSESDHESVESILQPCSFSLQEEETEAERKAEALLLQMKLAAPSFSFKFKGVENLLLDFFRERLTEGNEYDHELLEVVNDWMDGEPRDLVKGWEVQKNRQAYIRDMEKGGMWSKYDDEEKQEVGLELEEDVFSSLLNELCLDLFIS